MRSAILRLLAPALLGVLAITAWGQSDEERARSALKQLQQDIQRLDAELSSAKTRQDSLQGELREAEVTLGKLQQAIDANLNEATSNRQRLRQQQAQAAELETQRAGQQARIIAELRIAWQLGQQGQLKVLLNQENPHTVARAMTYYEYVLAARNRRVTAYRATLAELKDVQIAIEASAAELAERRQTLARQHRELLAIQHDRQQAVAQLNADISNKGDELKRLQTDRAQLEELLKSIEEAIISLQLPETAQPFTAAKGKMPWPVAGKPGNQFGRDRNEGKMRWQGVNILAEEGASVTAIHHGRVVYADWFRGSGLLLIIDHGDGYMSLYAHNQSLLREVGEWVSAGTPISTVGNTGGQREAALYFEIRHKGTPVNPSSWCHP